MNPRPPNLDRIMAHQYVGPEQPTIGDLARVYACWGMTPETVRVALVNQGVKLRLVDM
jgi:hypothetical protein